MVRSPSEDARREISPRSRAAAFTPRGPHRLFQRRRERERVDVPALRAIICVPTGSPRRFPNPTGIDTAGRPANDAGVVATSAAYPATAEGSDPEPSSPCSGGAHVGAVGVSKTSTPPPPPPLCVGIPVPERPGSGDFSKTRAKSRATSRRARIARSWYLAVSSVPEDVRPDHHPSTNFRSKTRGSRRSHRRVKRVPRQRQRGGRRRGRRRGRDRGRLGLGLDRSARERSPPPCRRRTRTLPRRTSRGCCSPPRARVRSTRPTPPPCAATIRVRRWRPDLHTRARPRAIPREPLR